MHTPAPVDTSVGSGLASVLQSSPEVALLSAPLILAMSYGLARSSAAGFGELKNAIFSEVAHGAIRKVRVYRSAPVALSQEQQLDVKSDQIDTLPTCTHTYIYIHLYIHLY